MTLLSQYYVPPVGQTPEQEEQARKINEAAADDWFDELKDFPAWAISNACRWWMSADNQDRRKKPLPGDIAERAFHEMGFVRIAGKLVERFDLKGPAAKAEHKPEPELSAEQKAELEGKFAALIAKMSGAALAEN